MAHVLVAGLAVVALVAVMTQANRRGRSRLGKVVLGLLLLVLGAVVLSLRRSGRRYRL